MQTTDIVLEFHQIRQMLIGYAMSEQAKEKLLALEPFLSERACRSEMDETTEARKILDAAGAPPLSAMREISRVLALGEKGSMLTPDQLEAVATFATSCKRMRGYLERAQSLEVKLAYYGQSFCELTELEKEIADAIQDGKVLSAASPALRDLRRRIDNLGEQVKRKLDELLRGRKNIFSDGFVSLRNGRYVLPVKKEYKNQVPGTVVDISGSGGTYFIEPSAVCKIQDEINTLKLEEDNEVRRILYTLTALVDGCATEIRVNVEAMATLDVAFAKAHLSAQMGAIPVVVDTSRRIEIRRGRHPLLRREECVPLDFTIGGETQGVVITGPNTGGKTVALKTVGLLSMMAQSGLHVPVEEGRFCMQNLILCDIGDGQSISENLSTFSAHIKNVIHILQVAGPQSLVLLDELGSGTDPAEGMGIAVAILEELRGKGCLFLVTTHYPEVKDYAARTPGLVNARMAFDRESLRPLYQLEIGEAGESCALYIAKRLGFPRHMLDRAHREAYGVHALKREDNFNLDAGPQPDVQDIAPPVAPRIEPLKPVVKSVQERPRAAFELGDSVTVSPDGKLGLVFAPVDEKGLVGVQVQGVKSFVNYKRLTLKTPASELYPPDYDFSILFDSVETRKARRRMDKHHEEGLAVTVEQIPK